jgi:hypothetical protein
MSCSAYEYPFVHEGAPHCTLYKDKAKIRLISNVEQLGRTKNELQYTINQNKSRTFVTAQKYIILIIGFPKTVKIFGKVNQILPV